MNYHARSLDRLSRELTSKLEDEFNRVGIFFRIFDRVKSLRSIEKKQKVKGEKYYNGTTKFIRDIIGIRIVLYFPDDIAVVHARIKKIFNVIEETIDLPQEKVFEPIRTNLVCNLPQDNISEFKDLTKNPLFDSSFEIQLRTILSEGWHEVDHDLRYKCQEEWQAHSDLSRSFNGILATLETSEYAILRLFDQLSQRHLKAIEIEAMFRTKFRLRLENYSISTGLKHLLSAELLKDFFKLERNEVVRFLFDSGLIIPLTLESLIFIVNFKYLEDPIILELTPSILLKELQNSKK